MVSATTQGLFAGKGSQEAISFTAKVLVHGSQKER